MKVTLLVRAPKKSEKRVIVEDDVVIGRGKDCNLQVLSNDVSRRHCQLVIGESEVAVRDLGSGNGTLINSQKTVPNVDTPLISGDIVRIGPLVIKVEFEYSTSQPVQSEPVEAVSEEALPEVSRSAIESAAEPLLEPADDEELLPAADDELLPADDEVSDDAAPEPLLVPDNADFADEAVVAESGNAFTSSDDAMELLGDEEELLDESDDFEDEAFEDEADDEVVDSGFADFLNSVDQPPT